MEMGRRDEGARRPERLQRRLLSVHARRRRVLPVLLSGHARLHKLRHEDVAQVPRHQVREQREFYLGS